MAIPLRHADRANITPITRTFFVTSSIAEKRNFLQSDRSARLFIDVVCHYRSEGRYRLYAFVVMPDHFHVIISVGPEITVERAVQFIKGGFAFRAGREFGFRPPVWQRGFSELRIYDSEHFGRVMEYVANNPTKRGLARSTSEYQYCSFYPGFELDDPPQGLKPRYSLLSTGTSKDVP